MSATTRRTLQLRTVAQLRDQARELQIQSTGKKSALVDRIYRALLPERQQAQQLSPQLHGGTPPPPRSGADSGSSDLAATVQQLLDGSLRGIEERLRRAVCPLPSHPPQATIAGGDNISLPSQTPAQQQPNAREPTAYQQEPTAYQQLPGTEEDETDAPLPTNPQKVQLPPVPARVRQRIVRGEFVDFDILLHDSLFPARYSANASPSLALRVVHDQSTSGEVLIAQQRSPNRRMVRDLASWMEAWNTYISVVLAHYPARALELLAYQRIICDASSRFPADCWLRYDSSFRACAAADRSLRWDGKHNDLWLECFTHHASSPRPAPARITTAKPARRPCTYCGDLYHFPHSCPHNPFRDNAFRGPKPSTTPPVHAAGRFGPGKLSPGGSSYAASTSRTGPNQPPVCKDFNRVACTRRQCRYRHACARCNETSHGEGDCQHPHAPPSPHF